VAVAEAQLKVETVLITELRPHPRNYQSHPEDQLFHIVESIQEHGLYRPVVIAKDGTILAGHGLVQAAKQLGYVSVPVIRMPLDPDEPRALKLLAGDNEISHLAERDDRLLSELLKEIKDDDLAGLLGTGYDEMMLANLVFVTRPESEIQDFDAAAAWAGMPGYEDGTDPFKLVISFENEQNRKTFVDKVGIAILKQNGTATWSGFWPNRQKDDASSLRYVDSKGR